MPYAMHIDQEKLSMFNSRDEIKYILRVVLKLESLTEMYAPLMPPSLRQHRLQGGRLEVVRMEAGRQAAAVQRVVILGTLLCLHLVASHR